MGDTNTRIYHGVRNQTISVGPAVDSNSHTDGSITIGLQGFEDTAFGTQTASTQPGTTVTLQGFSDFATGTFIAEPTVIPPFHKSDIKYYLSGGLYNKVPSKSLGGVQSTTEINNEPGNLFDQISQTELSKGSTMYRCLYVSNTGMAMLEDTQVWVDVSNTSTPIQLGVFTQTEVQRVTLSGTPVGGTFTLKYTASVAGTPVSQTTGDIQFDPDYNVTALNIKSALNSLALLGEVTTSGQYTNEFHYFVTFGGKHDLRSHQLLQVVNNSILGPNTLTVKRITPGSPINALAQDVGYQNQAPTGVTFNLDKTPIGTVDALDVFPVWLQRTVSPNSKITQDIIIINLSAQVEEEDVWVSFQVRSLFRASAT